MKQEVKCIHRQKVEESGEIFCSKLHRTVKAYECDKGNCPDCEFKPAAMIPVGRCDECRFCYKTRTPNAGYAYDYYCEAMKSIFGKFKIVGYVEYDSEIPPIPEWCPFRIKEE